MSNRIPTPDMPPSTGSSFVSGSVAGLLRAARAMKTGPDLRLAHGERSDRVPPRAERPKSYEVRVRRCIGCVSLVGHDGRGEPMLEVRIARRHISPSMIKNIEQWCRDNDTAPAVALHV